MLKILIEQEEHHQVIVDHYKQATEKPMHQQDSALDQAETIKKILVWTRSRPQVQWAHPRRKDPVRQTQVRRDRLVANLLEQRHPALNMTRVVRVECRQRAVMSRMRTTVVRSQVPVRRKVQAAKRVKQVAVRR